MRKLPSIRTAHLGVAAAAALAGLAVGLAALAPVRLQTPVLRPVALQLGDLSDNALKHDLRRLDPAEQALALRLDPIAHRQFLGRPLGWTRFILDTPPSLGLPDQDVDAGDARRINALIPVSQDVGPPARPFVLHASAEDRARAEQCLTQAIYYEAGFEPEAGREAVAQIVLNRLRHPVYPKSVCGVVFQGAQLTTGCQFSFTCDGSLARAPEPNAWAQARAIARRALSGFVAKQVGEATHYHADYVLPYWRASLVKITQIGAHIFYRWSGPGGAPAAFTGRYAGGEAQIPTAVLSDIGPQIALQAALKSGQERTVTLSYAGEVHTYKVVDPTAYGGARTRVAGVIYPARRQPTPEEVARINAALPPLTGDPVPASATSGPDPKSGPPVRPSGP